MTSAKAAYPWPTRKRKPYIDEYQVTSSDMTQIDGDHRHGERVDHDADAAEVLELDLPVAHIGQRVGVALERPAVQRDDEKEPDREADRRSESTRSECSAWDASRQSRAPDRG